MVTTRRGEQNNSTYAQNEFGGIGLLNRPIQNSNTTEKSTTNSEDKVRMRTNLERLLGYDTVAELTRQKEENKEEIAMQEQTLEANDEDLRPSSTTMQFTEDSAKEVIGDITSQKKEEDASYRLSKKGKIAIAIFSVITTVIMALIIVNTAVLSNLGNAVFSKQAELNATMTEYNNLLEENQAVSSEDHIRDVAENEYNMVKGN